MTPLVILISLALAQGIRSLCGNRSRMIIGW